MAGKNFVDITQGIHLKSYPMLTFLSEEQLNAVDLNVLWIPSQEDQLVIDELSARLDKYVVIYKSNYEPLKGHLCRMIKAATLDSNQINEVETAERRLTTKNQIVVVYEKPLVFRVL